MSSKSRTAVLTHPNVCPSCLSTSTYPSNFDLEGAAATQDWECEDCGAQWWVKWGCLQKTAYKFKNDISAEILAAISGLR